MTTLHVANDGPRIIATNYFDLDHARAGYVHLSPNAGALRLLVPPTLRKSLKDMRAASEVVISIGPNPAKGGRVEVEIMFDDESDSPFCLWIGTEQCSPMPMAGDKWTFATWGPGPAMLFERPAMVRKVARVPWTKPAKK